MTIIGKKIDAHLENHEKLDTQAGFTTGSMIEDNLFTLHYCIERSFKLRRLLIVTCLDYSKAFDSIKREKLIETLIHYKVHYKIIEVVANIYKDDYTEIQFGDIRKKKNNHNWHKARLYRINNTFKNGYIYDNDRSR